MLKIINKFNFFFKKKKKIIFVDDYVNTKSIEQELFKEKILAIDTEFDWRSTYFPILSLIQIATPTKIFILDCLKCANLDWLKKILEDEKKLVIFHSCRSDTTVLSKNLNIKIKKSFDIQIAEQKINGGEILNYAAIVKKYFSVSLDKSQTNSNWLKRPLSRKQIVYASEDVNYLIEIYNFQKKTLKKKNLLEKIFKKSENEASVGNQSLKDLRLKKVKNKFSTRDKQIFKWREELAEKDNVPPAFIFRNKDLKILSKIKSSDRDAKKKIMSILGDNQLTKIFMLNFL